MNKFTAWDENALHFHSKELGCHVFFYENLYFELKRCFMTAFDYTQQEAYVKSDKIKNQKKQGNDEKSLFKHEQFAIDEIKRNFLSINIGKLISNVLLFDNQTNNYYEYDLIMVTHSCIYVVELKHWSGSIKIEPYQWLINNTQYRIDPHRNNSFKCKVLKGIYQHKFRTYPNVWVESVVVLTNPDALIEGKDEPKKAAEQRINNPTFASIQDFLSYLRKREGFEDDKLQNDQINNIVKYISSLSQPKRNVKLQVPGYETVEYISQKPEYVELIARPVRPHAKGLYRFRVFRAPYQATPQEKERFLKRAHNTLSAIAEMGEHPYIHKVWVFENDEGDIIEGSEWSEVGTFRDIIAKQKQQLTAEKKMKYCRAIATALSDIHNSNLIHRAVKPENVFVVNDIPKLMNFDLAYQMEDNRITVIEDVSKLKDDGYIAPEVLEGGDIEEGTDYYSLGIIALELFTGEKVIKSTRAFKAQGGELSDRHLQILAEAGAPEKTIKAIQGMVIANRVERLNDDEVIIEAFSTEETKGEALTRSFNNELKPGSQHDTYEIVELIAYGAETQVYKARSLRQEEVVLKLFNKEVPRERVFKEEEATKSVNSAYVVKCKDIGYWREDRYYLVFEYIDGELLRAIIERKERPSLEFFRTVAMCLMEAIEAFHERTNDEGIKIPLVHSDIKPENVLITKDKKAILIDCGITGEHRIDTFQGTIGYIPPDSIIGPDRKYSKDSDLFALGVTLWEWLFGHPPYHDPSISDVVDIPESIDEDIPNQLINWLKRAVSTVVDERFDTVQEMREEFVVSLKGQEQLVSSKTEEAIKATVETKTDSFFKEGTDTPALIDLEQESNPFVAYLRSLPNVSAGNENATAEAQINNQYFNNILVKNPVTDYILEELLREKRNIVLTGNAGDGKTTIAIEILKELKGMDQLQDLQPIETLSEYNLVVVKDMSELSKEQKKEVINDAINTKEKIYLIITNTGTFLNSFKDAAKDLGAGSESELLKALKADEVTPIFNEKFWVINIGRLNTITTASQVFRRMMEQQNWVICNNCITSRSCPIYYNVRMIQEKIDVVVERIEFSYRRLYEYQVRLTMRQMTGHLAFAITAGRLCSDVQGMSHTRVEESLRESLFFDLFFGDDGKKELPEAKQLLPARYFKEAEFGVFLEPSFERDVWLKANPISYLLQNYPEPFQKLKHSFTENDATTRKQLRRLVFFCGEMEDENSKQYVSTFLRSPILFEYIKIAQGSKMSKVKESLYRRQILQVLQEFFTGIRFLEKGWSSNLFITLKRRFANTGTQLVLAEFPNDKFELKIVNDYTVGSECSKLMYLIYNDYTTKFYECPKMKLDLPFLDYVIRRYQGEVAEELSAYYADRLERFKVQLLEYNRRNTRGEGHELLLLTLDAERNISKKRIVIENEQMEVL